MLAFIPTISLAAIVVSAVPQFALASRAISILLAQRIAAEYAYVCTLISLSDMLELRDPYAALVEVGAAWCITRSRRSRRSPLRLLSSRRHG
jgi:hypothetical protein